VLEHIGTQGDWRRFLEEFEEYWRILKPGGLLFATVPRWDTLWAWGDPGHTRVINEGTLIFLSQQAYRDQVGKTPMTDYRAWYKGNFHCVHQKNTESGFEFVLEAVK
jgi:SAM-dependent methyltransferase